MLLLPRHGAAGAGAGVLCEARWLLALCSLCSVAHNGALLVPSPALELLLSLGGAESRSGVSRQEERRACRGGQSRRCALRSRRALSKAACAQHPCSNTAAEQRLEGKEEASDQTSEPTAACRMELAPACLKRAMRLEATSKVIQPNGPPAANTAHVPLCRVSRLQGWGPPRLLGQPTHRRSVGEEILRDIQPTFPRGNRRPCSKAGDGHRPAR